MAGIIVVIIMVFLVPVVVVLMNKRKVAGKMLCVMLKEDKSVDFRMCKLFRNFVFYGDRAYEVYPNRVRVTRFPSGWPSMLQELVPSSLFDEKDAIPLDWIWLTERYESAMKLRASIDENIYRTMAQVQVSETGRPSFNLKKALPFVLLAVGVIGLIFLIAV